MTGTKLSTVALLTNLVTVTFVYGVGTGTTSINLRARRTQGETTGLDLALCDEAQICLDALQTSVASLPSGTDNHDIETWCNGVHDAFVTYALCAMDHCDASCEESVPNLQETVDFVDSLVASYNNGVSCNFQSITCNNNTDGEGYEYEYDEYEFNNGTNATNSTEYEGEYEEEVDSPGTGNQTQDQGSFAVKIGGGGMISTLVLTLAVMLTSSQLSDRLC